MNSTRLMFAVGLLAITSFVAHASYNGQPGTWLGAARLPVDIAGWHGQDGPPLDDDTMRVLRADGVVNRVYVDEAQASPVDLYVAYYERQRPGVSIHSPLHCLPGTGWEVQSAGTLPVTLADGAAGEVRTLIAQKNRDRALVLYWYAVHGRMVGSEGASRLYLLGDRLRLGRNDAALVRVVVPMTGAQDAAEARGVRFIRAIAPHLPDLWS